MKKVAIILRGHIRVSFDDQQLYNLIYNLNNIYNIDIYIHTWNVKEAKLSYRKLVDSNKLFAVDEQLIRGYFADLSNKIKNIIIDDDENIKLIGDTSGKIINTSMPKLGWKRMWYSIYKNTEYVKNTNINYDFVINTRFDLFNNTNNLNLNVILDLLKNTKNFNVINFYHQKLTTGFDNLFYGSIEKIYQLCKDFHEKLDSILDEFCIFINRHQEFFPYYQALKIEDEKKLDILKQLLIENKTKTKSKKNNSKTLLNNNKVNNENNKNLNTEKNTEINRENKKDIIKENNKDDNKENLFENIIENKYKIFRKKNSLNRNILKIN